MRGRSTRDHLPGRSLSLSSFSASCATEARYRLAAAVPMETGPEAEDGVAEGAGRAMRGSSLAAPGAGVVASRRKTNVISPSVPVSVSCRRSALAESIRRPLTSTTTSPGRTQWSQRFSNSQASFQAARADLSRTAITIAGAAGRRVSMLKPSGRQFLSRTWKRCPGPEKRRARVSEQLPELLSALAGISCCFAGSASLLSTRPAPSES
mmetsp:Transcript_89226/g.158181  ORF Transcript_89226/g.158181 Transcript_89226/m.158181 type:complete len:209 (-) Transcript_89226:295-921(-)